MSGVEKFFVAYDIINKELPIACGSSEEVAQRINCSLSWLFACVNKDKLINNQFIVKSMKTQMTQQEIADTLNLTKVFVNRNTSKIDYNSLIEVLLSDKLPREKKDYVYGLNLTVKTRDKIWVRYCEKYAERTHIEFINVREHSNLNINYKDMVY